MRRVPLSLLAALALAAVATWLLLPGGVEPAGAHAALVAADPTPGTSVVQSPPAVVLRFSEALDRTQSAIEVSDPSHHDVTVGRTGLVRGTPSALRRRLAVLRPALYTIRWSAVSSDDGHREQGTYRFAVGVPLDGGSANATVTSSDERSLPGRVLTFLGIGLWIGTLVVGDAARDAGGSPRSIGRVLRIAPALTLVGSGVLLTPLVDPSAIQRSLASATATRFGALTLVVAAAAVAGLVVPRRRGVMVATALVALVAEVASSHTTATSWPVGAGVLLAVHLSAAGVWIAAVVLGSMSRHVGRTLRALAPWAVGAALVVVGSGVATAAIELRSPADLVSTGYGNVVLAKAAVVLVAATTGWWHRRARRDALAVRSILRPLRLEAAALLGGFVIAAVLVGLAPPTTAGALRPLPAPRASTATGVSVASAAGPFVVGITVAPPRGGVARTDVEVLGAPHHHRVVAVALSGQSRHGSRVAVRLHRRGTTTYVGRIDVERSETWTFLVAVRTSRGVARARVTVPLAARDGRGALRRAIDTQQQLESVRVAETVRSSTDDAGVVTDYRFHAPDAVALVSDGRRDTDVGGRSYHQSAGSARWVQETSGYRFRWPAPYFRQLWGGGVDARLLGRATVDGRPAHVVAFRRPDLSAWFRLWVDDHDGRVRREQMLAPGHLMEHRYVDFDAVPPITAP